MINRCITALCLGLTISLQLGLAAPTDAGSRLDPDRPETYLLAADRILIIDANEHDRALAAQLLARAAVYAIEVGDAGTASSACIAIASLQEPIEWQRLWWDAALLADPTRIGEWERANETLDARADELDDRARRCVTAARLHDLAPAQELLADIAVRDRIRACALESGYDPDRIISLIETEIGLAQDDPCRGRGFVGDRSNPGHRIVCPNHLIGLGMSANEGTLRTFLVLETNLGGVDPGSWGASMSAALARPSIPIGARTLVGRLEVRTDLPFYRDGRWVAEP